MLGFDIMQYYAIIFLQSHRDVSCEIHKPRNRTWVASQIIWIQWITIHTLIRMKVLTNYHWTESKHFSFRLIKFRKYKHRWTKWITSAIIKSIKYKGRLCKRLSTLDHLSPNYCIAKQNLPFYSKICINTIWEAKIDYYKGELNKNESYMRKLRKIYLKLYANNKPSQMALKLSFRMERFSPNQLI